MGDCSASGYGEPLPSCAVTSLISCATRELGDAGAMATMCLTSMYIESGPCDSLPLLISVFLTSLASGAGTQTPPLTIEMVIRGRRILLGGKRHGRIFPCKTAFSML